ncbi:protein takeout-like [Periplaneta americana]|uniref:protein takeout-like n=1 Tax=Periplaneta americana TaxID=6978 RepID=UPI0037E8E583
MEWFTRTMFRVVAAFLVFFSLGDGRSLKLPPYMVPCSRNDPGINDCALKHGKDAISRLVQGDKKYRIPVLEPLVIQSVRVDGGQELAGSFITLDDMSISGLSRANLENIKIDLEKNQIDWELSVPRIEIQCKYTVKGRVLILPIEGNGNGNITLTNVSLLYSFDFKQEKNSAGQEFLRIQGSRLNFDTSRAYIRLDNLFNGDKFLGNSMNRFLDENWREVVKDVGPYIADAIGQAIKQIISSIANLVPYDNIFPNNSV